MLIIADAGAVTYTVAAPVFVCLPAVRAVQRIDASFLFIFTRISGYFYFLLSTAFLMHFSACTTVLKYLFLSPVSKRYRISRLAHSNPQSLLT